MKKAILGLGIAVALVAAMPIQSRADDSAQDSEGSSQCTIAEVMKTLHGTKAYRDFEYSGNYYHEQGAPTLKQNETTDQYLFWVDDGEKSCEAVASYQSGACTQGSSKVKTETCETDRDGK